MKRALILILFFLLAIGSIIIYTRRSQALPQNNRQNDGESVQIQVSVVAQNLDTPWDIAFLPNKDMLITERSGKLTRIGSDSKTYEISGVTETSEGGLMGITIDPEFESNKFIYLFLTFTGNEGLENRIERYSFESDQLSDRKIVIDGIQGSSNHDGGRIRFGPDGYLYATTGDASYDETAQNRESLNGKILRIDRDGNIPQDNPFNSPVYSIGHRNSQGITWDSEKRLWATEHGRSGIGSGYDELNLIEKGKNYGWPEIQGDEKQTGLITPVINSGSGETWAPSGAAFYKNAIYFVGLRGQTLYKYDIKTKELKKYFEGIYGRLRAVTLGPDNYLYIGTSNNDGRGTPSQDDDKILKVNPDELD